MLFLYINILYIYPDYNFLLLQDYQFELDLGSENVDVQESGKYTLTLILGNTHGTINLYLSQG